VSKKGPDSRIYKELCKSIRTKIPGWAWRLMLLRRQRWEESGQGQSWQKVSKTPIFKKKKEEEEKRKKRKRS
jgi:hypothetical protein